MHSTAHTHFVYTIGATSAGKGFLYKLTGKSITELEKSGIRIGWISFGQIIRDLMKSDAEFQREYGEMIRGGDLVDDTTAIRLFEEELSKLTSSGPLEIIFVDGFLRTPRQVEHATDHGYLQAKDSVFILNASFETCLERFAHRKETDKGRTETEIETFRKRYHLHADTIIDLRALLKESEAREFDIDADRGIPDHVFPDFIGRLMPILFDAVSHHKTIKPLRTGIAQT